MRRLSFIYTLLWLFAAGIGFTACSSSDIDDNGGNVKGKLTRVTLNLSTGNAVTRAGGTPTWTDGGDNENMYSWIVVVTNKSDVVQKVLTSSSALDNLSKDEYTLDLSAGDYYFYSFANITAAELGNPTEGSTVSFDDKVFTVDGNGRDISTNHIPMSNKQTVTVAESGTQTIDLWVVRMLAKVELKLTNATDNSVTVTEVSLSDVTSNVENNLLLLPDATDGADKIACKPRINTTDKAEYTYTLTQPVTIAKGETKTVTFYVNESLASEPQYFVLSVTTKASETSESGTQRFAMLEWKQIARNDYRIIPVTLDDYKVEYDVQQFTAIGTLPDVTFTNGTLNIVFGNYGEFHIIPAVKKISTGETVSYGTAAGNWSMSEVSAEGSTGDKYFPVIEQSSTSIYRTLPVWDTTLHLFEGYIKPYDGYAIHQMNITLPSGRTMAVRTQVNMKFDATRAISADNGYQGTWRSVHVSE